MMAKSIVTWARELPGGVNSYDPGFDMFFIYNYNHWLESDPDEYDQPQDREATVHWKSL